MHEDPSVHCLVVADHFFDVFSEAVVEIGGITEQIQFLHQFQHEFTHMAVAFDLTHGGDDGDRMGGLPPHEFIAEVGLITLFSGDLQDLFAPLRGYPAIILAVEHGRYCLIRDIQ